MRNLFFFLVFFLGFINQSMAQDTGLSFEVHYPITFSDKDYEPTGSFDDLNNQYYDNWGVLGGVFQYQITDNIPFNFGAEFKFDVFQSYKTNINNNNTGDSNETKPITFLWSHINVYSKMLFESLPELQLYVTGGFTVYKYNKGGVSPNYIGFNAGGGLQYDIFNEIYIISSFSHMQTKITDTNDNIDKEKYQLLRVGLGFKL